MQLSLKQIVRYEVACYEAISDLDTIYAILDDENPKYAVVIIPSKQEERPAWAICAGAGYWRCRRD